MHDLFGLESERDGEKDDEMGERMRGLTFMTTLDGSWLDQRG